MPCDHITNSSKWSVIQPKLCIYLACSWGICLSKCKHVKIWAIFLIVAWLLSFCQRKSGNIHPGMQSDHILVVEPGVSQGAYGTSPLQLLHARTRQKKQQKKQHCYKQGVALSFLPHQNLHGDVQGWEARALFTILLGDAHIPPEFPVILPFFDTML